MQLSGTGNNPPRYIRAEQFKIEQIDVSNIKRYQKHKVQFYNYPVAFDIETSSFMDGDEPRACMYIWQMCFGDGDFYVYGRTWQEFLDFIQRIRKHFHLKKDRVLCIYVHNLAYEFQWIRTFFQWQKVFAVDAREVLYARTKFGVEFRCSYKLSGFSLATLAKNLTRHNLEKLDTLDYGKIRHSETPIKPEEMAYNFRDVEIVCAYISERLEIDGNITKLPLTKTGYVRQDCKDVCYGTDRNDAKYYNYRREMQRLIMEVDEYKLMRCAFMGGYVHGNAWYIGQTITNGVKSKDFTSSYPSVLFVRKYPWSKGILCYPDLEELTRDLFAFGWIIDVEFYGVESTTPQDDYLSASRCVDISGETLNNGRVNSADYIHVVLTSLDFDIMLKTYRFKKGIKILRAYKYYMQYLPTDFIKEMLTYYQKKTELKDVDGMEEEYLQYKGALNSFYGMVCTSPIRPEIIYQDDEWSKNPVEYEKGIAKYNNNPNRFLPFIVGVFCTAYARWNLWSGILACGDDYLYADTDSIKLINYEKHVDYFNNYNDCQIDLLKRACEYHEIPFGMCAPYTVEGKQKLLGVWDDDGYYSRFKFLGAKRYMTERAKDGKISLTVSGLNKEKAIPYLLDKYGSEGIFDAFTDDIFHIDSLVIPAEYSGRTVSTYIDEPTSGTVVDYLGNAGLYSEKTSVHIASTTYTLSLSKDYLEFLLTNRKVAF